MVLFVDAFPHIHSKTVSRISSTTSVDDEKQNSLLEKAVIESYKNMRAKFEGETKREFVKKISNLGFDSLLENAEIKFIKNMQGQYFDAFADNFITSLIVEEASRGKIREYLDFVPFSEVGHWNMMSSMYNSNAQSHTNYICLMTYRDE
jgi:hypothetical protein